MWAPTCITCIFVQSHVDIICKCDEEETDRASAKWRQPNVPPSFSCLVAETNKFLVLLSATFISSTSDFSRKISLCVLENVENLFQILYVLYWCGVAIYAKFLYIGRLTHDRRLTDVCNGENWISIQTIFFRLSLSVFYDFFFSCGRKVAELMRWTQKYL